VLMLSDEVRSMWVRKVGGLILIRGVV
jgi:hypothetical protein